MKKKFILPVLFLFSCTFVFCGTEDLPESIPSYRVVKSAVDATLKPTEAVFSFRFYAGTNKNPIKETIKFSYNNIQKNSGRDPQGKFSLPVSPGKYIFQFFYNEDYYEITTDSISILPSHRTEIEVYFQSSVRPVLMKKPVIYVYAERKIEVKINLEMKQGKLDFTYPEYRNGWNFTADSTGTISMGEKQFNYLFWEGESKMNDNKIDFTEGFLVEKNNLIKFFEEKLSKMGLTSKESADFITYWCPLMSANEKNYVHFLFTEEVNEYAQLSINPKPDNIFRVFMIWSKADEKNTLKITEQKIPVFERKGLTVVEWGGSENKIIVQ